MVTANDVRVALDSIEVAFLDEATGDFVLQTDYSKRFLAAVQSLDETLDDHCKATISVDFGTGKERARRILLSAPSELYDLACAGKLVL